MVDTAIDIEQRRNENQNKMDLETIRHSVSIEKAKQLYNEKYGGNDD